MQQIAKGRTVIIIAHRLSTVRHSDRIITIDRGRIVEDGTHDELVRTGGRYAALHPLPAGLHENGSRRRHRPGPARPPARLPAPNPPRRAGERPAASPAR